MNGQNAEYLKMITHKGHEIWYADYRGLMAEELAQRIRDNTRISHELAREGKVDRLSLADFRDCVATQEVVDAIRKSGAEVKPYLRATAVVGVGGIRKHLLNILNKATGMGARAFDTLEEAMDWLVEQGRK